MTPPDMINSSFFVFKNEMLNIGRANVKKYLARIC